MRQRLARTLPCLGLLCCLLSLHPAPVPAGAPQVGKAPTTPAPLIGWGKPIDGLQIGLFPQSNRRTYRYGDTLTFLMRVKNVSATTLNLEVKVPETPLITLGEGRHLVIQTGGGTSQSVSILPGEVIELPGCHFDAQIAAPGVPHEDAVSHSLTLALLPGDYSVECNLPLWFPDKDDANRATAHRAKPGIFSFTVLDPGVARGPAPARSPAASRKEPVPNRIHWGEVNNGLQGGILLVTTKDREVLPPEKRQEPAPNEIPMLYYLRNATDKPLSVSYALSQETDWSPWVRDASGKDRQVNSTFFTGDRPLQDQILQPGQIQQIGWARLKFQTADAKREEGDYTPLLVAEPGHYTVRLVNSVRYSRLDRMDVVLISGELPFDIPAP